jgi:Tol biopolymer transport system component
LIAFTRTTAAGSSIAVVEPDRSGFRTLIDNASQPAWSADGRSIAFIRKSAQGDWDIFIANADGSGVRELAIPGHDEYVPAWSPDGRQLAFNEYPHGGHLGQIDVVNIDGSGRRQLTHDVHSYGDSPGWPEWSPDGQWILFNDKQGTFSLIHPDGSGLTAVDGTDSLGPASLSPDGKQIAYNDIGCAVCVSLIDGKHFRQVPHVGRDAVGAVWSRDGREIVFSREIITKTKVDHDLYVINADGSGLRPLVRGKASTRDPAWQPTTTGP